MTVKQKVRSLVRGLGFDVIRYDSLSSPLARRAQILSSYGINVVLDVGANTGQFAQQLRSIGYRGRIVSFEPLSSAYRELKKKAEADAFWRILNIALGDANGKRKINIAGNSYSSSLLEMLPSHVGLVPESEYTGTEEIEIRRLDSITGDICSSDDNIYLKIDTQGYEKNVIDGAEKCLSYIHTVQIEMSLWPLYKDELLFHEMYDLLYQKGYRLVSIEPSFVDERTGQLFQVDGTFHRFPS